MERKNVQETMESCSLVVMFKTPHAKTVLSVPGGHLLSELYRVPWEET